MSNNRMHEHGKSRAARIRTAEICNGMVMGIAAVWAVWAATSVLIHLMR